MLRDILIAAVVIVGLIVIALLQPSAAQADTIHDFFYDSPHRTFSRVKYRRRGYRAPIEREWRDEDEERGAKCLDEPVKVISTEHTSKENALEAAKKMWAFNVQWEKGSRFMSLDLASDYREYCGQSNAMDTASGKINEAVNQLAGREGVNVRCVIRARPCRAILEQAEGHR